MSSELTLFDQPGGIEMKSFTSREAKDEKYNAKMPNFTIRISPDLLKQIPTPRAPWIVDAIQTHLGHKNSEGRTATTDDETQSRTATKDALLKCLVGIFIDQQIRAPIPTALASLLRQIIETEM
jgi:hypothetical protein